MLCRQTGVFLLPFALTAPLGVGIGVALSDVNPWAQMVLYALATGFFIYVGACEVMTLTLLATASGKVAACKACIEVPL